MPSEVRFTRAQKWDLARMSAAAVASTVFFTVPMFLVRPQTEPTAQPVVTAGTRFVAELSQPASPAAMPTEPTTTTPAVDSPNVTVVTSTERAAVTTPALQGGGALRVRASRPAELRAKGNGPSASQSLSRRLARIISGTGKYSVKPFPTITTSGT
jgi:hypothetical protein